MIKKYRDQDQFTSFYNHSRLVFIPPTLFNMESGYEETNHQVTVYNPSSSNGLISMRKDSFNYIQSKIESGEVTIDQLRSYYFPPTDSLTDEDFIDWVKSTNFPPIPSIASGRSRKGISRTAPWRVKLILDKTDKKILNYSDFRNLVTDFFSKSSRSERILRVIELNEFIHRGRPDQTFKNFLQNDEEVLNKCEDLELSFYSDRTLRLADSEDEIPISDFKRELPMVARRRLLDLTPSQIEKVFLKFENNPHYKSDARYEDNADKATCFIDAAISVDSENSNEIMSFKELSKWLSKKVMSDPDFWGIYADKCNSLLSTVMFEVFASIDSALTESEPFREKVTNLIKSKSFDGLNPMEVISALFGLKTPILWLSESSSTDALDNLSERMNQVGASHKATLELISHVVLNPFKRITVNSDFDWSILVEGTPHWSYELFETESEQKYFPQLLRALTKS